jgi:ATP-dependent exoDNAse (exonuclease V) beta subunit
VGGEAALGSAGKVSGDEKTPELYFGSLCHRIIELLPEGGLSADGELVLKKASVLRAMRPLEEDSPSGEDYEGLFEEALRLGENFFASDFFRRLFGEAQKNAAVKEKIEAEVPFVMNADSAALAFGEEGLLVNGVMDLVIHLPAKTVVVDFKTDRAVRPEDHEVQLALYRAAALHLWGKESETWLYYLRSGEAVRSEGRPLGRREACENGFQTTRTLS